MALPRVTRPLIVHLLGCLLLLLAHSTDMGAVGVYGDLVCTPSPVQFTSTPIGGSQTLPIKLSNTGSVTLTITKVLLQAPGFTMSNLNLPASLAPGKTISLTVTFAPEVKGQSGGTIAFFSNYASDSVLFVNLAGTGISGPDLTAAPASQSFGNVKVGNSKTVSETITNAGGSSLSLAAVSVSGTSFSKTGLSLPLVLTAGESYTFHLVFAPKSTGGASGTLSVTPASGSAVSVALSGTGTTPGSLGLTPSSLNFGNVVIGQGSSSTVALKATGASITVNSATLNSSEFSLSGVSFPLTIAAGNSSTMTVTFTPQSSGAASGKITLASTAGNSAVESVSGSGLAGTTYSVVLSWSQSASTVAGYNVYRATTGGYSKINTVLDASTSYTDSTVQAGTTYYYETTAVSASGVESKYSNQVKVAIPSP